MNYILFWSRSCHTTFSCMGCDMRRREDCVEMSDDRGAAMNIKRNTVQSYSTEY